MAVISILWIVVGFSLAFGDSVGGLIGNPTTFFMFRHVGALTHPDLAPTIPLILFALFQLKFAIITPALITGSFAERVRFTSYLLFMCLFSIFIYAPLAHWTWHPDGFLHKLGVLDFAGGTVVHINAGISALVAASVLGARKDYARQAILPHNVPFTLLGAGLLWFGWFGFNGGSALAANGSAALAFVNTFLAPMATLMVWVGLDSFRTGHATAVGGATGIVVGLVAITPAAGFVSPLGALALGAIAAFPSYFAIVLRSRTRLDDSLDVFAGHGVGGLTGALLTGVFALKAWGGTDGLLGGNPSQLGIQAIAAFASMAYAGIMTFVILKLLALVAPLRVATPLEGLGLDVTQHGEEAYSSGEGSILVLPEVEVPAPAPSLNPQPAAR
jgi:ammonium transporter, Amt family